MIKGNSISSSSTSVGMSAATKKMTIKPFKSQPKLPDNYEIDTWSKLKSALSAVNGKIATPYSKEELYRAVEDLCMHKFAPKLYDNLTIECKRYIDVRVDSLSNQSSDYTVFLKCVDSIWKDHCDFVVTVRNIFLYLDRSYVLSTNGVREIWDFSTQFFRERLETKPEVEIKIIVGLLANVEAHRRGREIDEDMIKRVLQMLLSLNLYKQKFESAFLVDSTRFFASEGSQLVDHCDASVFIEHVDKRLHEATGMVTKYLDSSTRLPLIQIIEQHLFTPHVNVLLEKGLSTLLQGDRVHDLKRFHSLMDRVNMLDRLKQGWSNYVKVLGGSLVQDEEREKYLIDDILLIKDRMDVMLKISFNNEESFKDVLKSALEYVVNIKATKESELMARHIDRKMKGEKGISEQEVETSLDKFMALFKLIQGKDVFEAFYKKFLAKRLFLGKSANFDLEKIMLSKLKTECGSNFTSKLEGMFQDIEMSRDIMQDYQQFCASKASPSSSSSLLEPETVIQILTTGYWPSFMSTDKVVVPAGPLPAIMARFNAFYCNKYQGRRLAWAHSLARCIITAKFPRGKKELEVSFLQALVLLCFNKADQLSLTDIRTMTNIEDAELRRTLQSLANGVTGTRVLYKEPRGKEVEDSDAFRYNADFSNKLFRIKINTIQLKETSEEIEKTHEEIFRERQYQVDAAIVRVMKARKRLSHNILMGELMAQVKFQARPSDLKTRIESLIERDYLERDKDDNTFYNYLA